MAILKNIGLFSIIPHYHMIWQKSHIINRLTIPEMCVSNLTWIMSRRNSWLLLVEDVCKISGEKQKQTCWIFVLFHFGKTNTATPWRLVLLKNIRQKARHRYFWRFIDIFDLRWKETVAFLREDLYFLTYLKLFFRRLHSSLFSSIWPLLRLSSGVLLTIFWSFDMHYPLWKKWRRSDNDSVQKNCSCRQS